MVRHLRWWWVRHRLHFRLYRIREADGQGTRIARIRMCNALLDQIPIEGLARPAFKQVRVSSHLATAVTLLTLVNELNHNWERDERLHHRHNLVAPIAGEADAHHWLWVPVHKDRSTLDGYRGNLFNATNALLTRIEALAEDQPQYVDRSLKFVEDGHRALVELLVTLVDLS